MREQKTHTADGNLSQFTLSKNLLQNLGKFDISLTSKMVLMYLADCYNPKKATIFPKQKTIAEKLGVSERSVTRAIKELTAEGLIMYETKGLLNHYKFTAKIFASVKMSDNRGQIGGQLGDKMACNNKQYEQKKNISYFNKNEGVKYKTPEQTKADYAKSVQTDHKSPINDKETAVNWIKTLTPTTLKMKPIQKTLSNVIDKWNFSPKELEIINKIALDFGLCV